MKLLHIISQQPSCLDEVIAVVPDEYDQITLLALCEHAAIWYPLIVGVYLADESRLPMLIAETHQYTQDPYVILKKEREA